MSYAPYPTYKESGVPWLGQVPEAWEVKPVKYISTFNDEALPETTDPESMLNYVDISSVSLVEGIQKIEQVEFEKAPSRARRVVREGDTIVSTVRTYLKSIATVRNPVDNMIVSTGFAVIRPDPTMNPDFLGYFIQSEGFVGEVVSKSTGVSYPAINPGDLVAISGVRPPIEEQTAIARFLDEKTAEIDDLIAKKEELLRLLAEQRTALITHAVTKGLNPSAPMRPSGIDWLGDVPEGWEITSIKRIASIFGRIGFKGYTTADIVDEGDGALSLSPSNIFEGKMRYEKRTYVSWEKYFESPEIMVKPGDIVFVKTGSTIGKTALFEDIETETTVNPQLVILKELTVSGLFLSFAMNSAYFRHQVDGYRFGGSTPAMTQESLGRILVVAPKERAEQEKIAANVSIRMKDFDKTQQKIKAVIEALVEYRIALITNAVTGKIKVA